MKRRRVASPGRSDKKNHRRMRLRGSKNIGFRRPVNHLAHGNYPNRPADVFENHWAAIVQIDVSRHPFSRAMSRDLLVRPVIDPPDDCRARLPGIARLASTEVQDRGQKRSINHGHETRSLSRICFRRRSRRSILREANVPPSSEPVEKSALKPEVRNRRQYYRVQEVFF